jgi:hypothetical protein
MNLAFGSPLVYRLAPQRRALLVVVWALLTLPLLLAGWLGDDGAALAAGLLAGLVLGLVFLLAGWRFPRLILSEHGIALHQPGYRLEADWTNVAALRLTPGSEGLVLRFAGQTPGYARLAAASGVRSAIPLVSRPYPPEVMDLIAARRFLPLDAFAHWLRRGDLECRIRHHAPGLGGAAA